MIKLKFCVLFSLPYFNHFASSLSDLSVEISKAAVEPENNLSNGDIEVQKLRVEQMRRLRKELRKLEKLERLRLNKAVGGSPSVDAELMRQIQVYQLKQKI